MILYVIPIREESIFYNELSLKEILYKCYPEFKDRHYGRVDILYSERATEPISREVKDRLKIFDAETNEMERKLKIPWCLIAISERDGVYLEAATKKVLTGSEAAFERNRKSLDYIHDFVRLYDGNYFDDASGYFEKIDRELRGETSIDIAREKLRKALEK